MIVVTLTDCPPRLRGDLSKWLLEINTGVYVGQLNKRVREELWKRICDNLPRGRATMVYSANNEQGMEFRVHNTRWMPVDFEGLTLMMRPATTESGAVSMDRSSKAAISRMVQNKRAEQDKREAMLSLMLKRRDWIQHTTRFWKLVHYESLNIKYRNAFRR